MAKYIIEGGHKLTGEVNISGNKNSILPCLAASLLTDEEVTLQNVPEILDVEVMLSILEDLGVEVKRGNHVVKLTAKKIKDPELPEELISKLRASILLIGPLLARVGKVHFSHPGGDVIGKRSIETHIAGLSQLGFEFSIHDRSYRGIRANYLEQDGQIFLDEASCTATENLIIAAVIGKFSTTLKNCAREPQVVDLCNLLNMMGARIEGAGNPTIIIRGVEKLKGADYKVSNDYIEMGTYAIAAAITKGEIKFENYSLEDIEPITYPLFKMGLKFRELGPNLEVSGTKILPLPKLVTNIWPGFPTDLMSAMIVLATQARGVSLMHDWMYESRMFFVDKLISMGANITIADPHRVVIYGPTKLRGRELETPDIRAGMALVLAGLVAKGTSIINRAELIERGYENVVKNLQSLGAKIVRIE